MSHRLLASLGARAVVIATLSLAPVGVEGQAPSSAAKGPKAAAAKTKTWTLPRTPDGRPDLQGVWSFATITPMERPSELAGKQVLTDEEAAEFEQQAFLRNNADRRDGGAAADVSRAYNNFWFDRGTKVIGTKRTSLVVDPPEGRIPPLTPEGQKRVDALAAARQRPAHGPEDRGVGERCLMGFNSGPPMVPGGYNQNVQLLQIPGYVVILNEMVHNARIVPLDGRPHGAVRQWVGDSRGRWEGDTLVVDTTSFYDTTAFRGSSRNLHLVERFTRVDAGTIHYEFTVDDPTTWTRPWTAAIPMTKTQDQIYEYSCHEGNYGMLGLLEGARAEEKAAAAKKGSN